MDRRKTVHFESTCYEDFKDSLRHVRQQPNSLVAIQPCIAQVYHIWFPSVVCFQCWNHLLAFWLFLGLLVEYIALRNNCFAKSCMHLCALTHLWPASECRCPDRYDTIWMRCKLYTRSRAISWREQELKVKVYLLPDLCTVSLNFRLGLTALSEQITLLVGRGLFQQVLRRCMV